MSGREISDVSLLAKCLQNDGVVIAPTDTVWGLLAPITMASAQAISEIKGRDEGMGFVLLLPSFDWIAQICEPLRTDQLEWVQRYSPGAVTYVLPKSRSVPDSLSGGRDTIALRIPESEFLQSLFSIYKAPLLSSSANFHGEASPASFAALSPSLISKVNGVWARDEEGLGLASTIVDLSGDTPRLLRSGSVSLPL